MQMWSVSVCVLSTRVSCAKTAEPVEMPLGGLTYVGPRNHVSGSRIKIPTGRNNFGGCPAHWKVLGVSAAVYTAKRIIQSWKRQQRHNVRCSLLVRILSHFVLLCSQWHRQQFESIRGGAKSLASCRNNYSALRYAFAEYWIHSWVRFGRVHNLQITSKQS